MNAIKSERQGLADQRKTHRDSEKEMRDRARQSERGMKDLSRSAEDLNEETLCEKIAAIEYKLSVTSMTLKEEKGLMMEIKKLKVGGDVVCGRERRMGDESRESEGGDKCPGGESLWGYLWGFHRNDVSAHVDYHFWEECPLFYDKFGIPPNLS